MNIVFLDASTIGSDISLEPISRHGNLTAYDTTDATQVFERIKDAEVIITNKVVINRSVIDAAPSVRLICEAATGVNNIDVAYAESKGIKVRNVAGYSTECVAQVTFMHILNLVGRGPFFDRFVHDGSYSRCGIFTEVGHPFRELHTMKLGIIGMGAIGQRVASIATAFGMNVSYFSTSGTSHCRDYPSLPLEQLLRESDVISVHAPLNEKTLNLISYSGLSQMKKNAYIINMGRGGIINEADLVRALNDGIISGAATDVHTREPLPADHPFLKDLRNPSSLILSPHIGWAGNYSRRLLVERIGENIAEGW